MIHYLLLNSDGTVRQRGRCVDEQNLPTVEGLKVEVIKEDDPRQPATPVRNSYEDLRRMAYPTSGDQLDAIWAILEAAGLVQSSPQSKAVLDRIKAVKTQFPKK